MATNLEALNKNIKKLSGRGHHHGERKRRRDYGLDYSSDASGLLN